MGKRQQAEEKKQAAQIANAMDFSSATGDSLNDRYAMTQQVPLTVFERSLRNQIVFGSNNPRIEIKSMAKAVRALGFSEECLELIFRVNAMTLLGGRL